ncbi:MAG: DUF2239 family protein [Gemmatimonadales bacterium]
MTSTSPAPAVPELIAFDGHALVARGAPTQVALRLHRLDRHRNGVPFLIFEAETGRQLDLDLSGSEADVLARLGGTSPTSPDPQRGPGRPRLGVVAREVTLLPRHWEWLGTQPGGASATLRRLVEAARRHAERADPGRDAREATYRFMSATAGDLPGFEEASRALFAGAFARLAERIADWPRDVRTHVAHLAARAEAAAAETGSEPPPV